MKPCSLCGLVKPLADFHCEAKASDGRNSHCRACERIRAAAYYRKHAKARLVYQRMYEGWKREQRRVRAAQGMETES